MQGRKPTRKETINAQTVRAMKTLGTFKPEYLSLVDIYAELKAEYIKIHAEYEADGYRYSEPSSGGEKKSPIVATLEGLRKDILAYSDRLMLNPKAFSDKAAVKKQKLSPLAAALKEVESRGG